ncbi:hypothetical protein [Shimia sp. Alg240-R146]|uniref:hypothetical protein n=1 Tax=Shimia sp. Alg240-R146 TaxID=2993449 RepID=UPI0022E444FB|nr:hypothetical protein [Shimia sp. Alg240-R146]
MTLVGLYGLRGTLRELLSIDDIGIVSAHAQYQIWEYRDWGIAVQGAVEHINWQTGIPVGGRLLSGSPAGSLGTSFW